MDDERNRIFADYHKKRVKEQKLAIEYGALFPGEQEYREYDEDELKEIKAKEELKEFADAIEAR